MNRQEGSIRFAEQQFWRQAVRFVCGRMCLAAACFSFGSMVVAVGEMPTLIAQDWNDIERWEFEIETEIVFQGDGEGARSRDFKIHRLFAVSQSDLYHLSGHDRDHRLKRISWLREPFNLETTLHDGKLTRNQLFNRCFSTEAFNADSEFPEYIARDTLIFIVPKWPLTGFQSPRLKPETLLVVGEAVGSDLYQRTDEQPVVDDERCYVLEARSGHDRIVISIEKPLCVLQREIKNPKTGKLSFKLASKKLAEVGPNLWMPVELEHSNFDSLTTDHEGNMISTSVTRLLNWKFNSEIPDERFAPTIKPGSIEQATDESFQQVRSGGVEHLDEIAQFIQEQRSARPDEGRSGNRFQAMIIFTIAFVTGLIISTYVSTRHGSVAPR